MHVEEFRTSSSSSSTPLTPADLASLYDEPVKEFMPVAYNPDGSLSIAPHLLSLPVETQHSIRYLWSIGDFTAATRLGECRRHGSITKESRCGKHAIGHRHTCHLLLCEFCMSPQRQLHCWARTRNDDIWEHRQTGIEVIGPIGSDVDAAARSLARHLAPDSIRKEVIPKPKATDTRVRLVVHSSERFKFKIVLAALRRLAGPEFHCQLKSEDSPAAILKWLFAATESLILYPGCQRVQLIARQDKKHHRTIRTTGKFYSPVEGKKDFASSDDTGNPVHCPCGCGDMVFIPRQERQTRSISDIEKQYVSVSWTGCFDPFYSRRKVIGKDAPTDNFSPGRDSGLRDRSRMVC